jgi:hypothetical protein
VNHQDHSPSRYIPNNGIAKTNGKKYAKIYERDKGIRQYLELVEYIHIHVGIEY